LSEKGGAVGLTDSRSAGGAGGASDGTTKGAPRPGGASSTGVPGVKAGSTKAGSSSTATMALSVVANRSSAVGVLSTTAARAQAICDAGAYIHW
jgi:hypothetical protein